MSTVPPKPANDNRVILIPSIDAARPGQALTIDEAHRRFGRTYAEFVRAAGDGRHVYVRKLLSGRPRARWSEPLKIDMAIIRHVHTSMARGDALLRMEAAR